MGMLGEIFSWWGGNTWGTRLFTWRKGRLVGEDEAGNRYYTQRSGVGPLGVPARWVIYRDLSEPSQVPPDWHGWLHHTIADPPSASDAPPKPWQKAHQPNLTGTAAAYRPKGSILGAGERRPSTGDYTPWRPN